MEDIAQQAAKAGETFDGIKKANLISIASQSVNPRRLSVASDPEASALSTLPDLPTHQRVLQELHGFCASGGNCGVQEAGPAARIRAGYRPGPRRRLSEPVEFETRSIFVKGIGRVKKNEFCNKHRLFNWNTVAEQKGIWKAVKVRDDTNSDSSYKSWGLQVLWTRISISWCGWASCDPQL